MKPIMTDLGLFNWDGSAWLLSDGEFPFDDCNDRTSSDDMRSYVCEQWAMRKQSASSRIIEEYPARSGYCNCGYGDCDICGARMARVSPEDW